MSRSIRPPELSPSSRSRSRVLCLLTYASNRTLLAKHSRSSAPTTHWTDELSYNARARGLSKNRCSLSKLTIANSRLRNRHRNALVKRNRSCRLYRSLTPSKKDEHRTAPVGTQVVIIGRRGYLRSKLKIGAPKTTAPEVVVRSTSCCVFWPGPEEVNLLVLPDSPRNQSKNLVKSKYSAIKKRLYATKASRPRGDCPSPRSQKSFFQ
jgi:hypothetical protein